MALRGHAKQTPSRLRDGDVIYLTTSRSCDPAIEDAHHFALARLRVAHDRSEFHDLLTSHIKHLGGA
jgi:hypothetical protein